MFTDKDRQRFDKTIDNLINFGEKVGLHINKKSTWVIKTVIIGGAVLLFGGLFFLWAILRKSVGEKD